MSNKKMKALIAVLSVSLAIGLAALGAGIISSKASSASGSAVAPTTSTSGGESVILQIIRRGIWNRVRISVMRR